MRSTPPTHSRFVRRRFEDSDRRRVLERRRFEKTQSPGNLRHRVLYNAGLAFDTGAFTTRRRSELPHRCLLFQRRCHYRTGVQYTQRQCQTLDRRRVKRNAGVKDQTGVFHNMMPVEWRFSKAHAGLRLETGMRYTKRRFPGA